jgi:transposase
MHSKFAPRRQHGAELKAKILSACEELGASISAVAPAHGLNANLVLKWREGRGLKRSGVIVPGAATSAAAGLPVSPSAAPAPVAGDPKP